MNEKLNPDSKDSGIRDCCKLDSNLKRISESRKRCAVCGASHYRLVAEPGKIGSSLKHKA